MSMELPQGAIALSHTQCETFAGCQRQWWLAKEMRAPTAMNAATALGHAVHAALEADLAARHRGKIAEGAPGDVPALYQVFTTALAAEWAQMGEDAHPDATQRAYLLGKGLSVLRLYAERLAPTMRPVEPPEREFTVAHPHDDLLYFTGREDAVTEREVGGRGRVRTTLDFKILTHQWEPGEERHKAQATRYLLAERWADWRPSDQVCFVTFYERARLANGNKDRRPQPAYPLTAAPDGEQVRAVPMTIDLRPTTRSAADLRDEADELLALGAAVVSGLEQVDLEGQPAEVAFPPNPRILCAWCDVLGVCQTGQSWLAAHTRAPEKTPVTWAGAWRVGERVRVRRGFTIPAGVDPEQVATVVAVEESDDPTQAPALTIAWGHGLHDPDAPRRTCSPREVRRAGESTDKDETATTRPEEVIA